MVQHLPKESGLKVSIQSYHRGWFHSTAIIQIMIDTNNPYQLITKKIVSSTKAPKLYLNIKETISHGPFIITHNTEGHLACYIARAYASGQLKIPLSERDIINFVNIKAQNNHHEIIIDLDGKIRAYFNFPKLQIETYNKKNAFLLENFKLKFTVDSKNQHQKAKLSIDNFTYAYEKNTLSLQHLNHRFDLKHSLSNLWIGSSRLFIQKLTFDRGNQRLFDMNQFHLMSNTDLSDKNYLLNFILKIQSSKIQIKNYHLNRVNIEFSANMLDAKALNRLKILDEKFNTQQLSSREYLDTFNYLISDLLGHGAILHLYPAELHTPEGAIGLSSHTTFPDIKKDHIHDTWILFKNIESLNQAQIPKKLLITIVKNYFYGRYIYTTQTADEKVSPLTKNELQALIDAKALGTFENWKASGYLREKQGVCYINLNYKDGEFK